MHHSLLLVFILQISTILLRECKQLNSSIVVELEALGEAYYASQKGERSVDFVDDIVKIGANFPCILGTIPIGGSDKTGIDDGHKFGCGIHAIEGSPVLISFGSHKDQRFELAFLDLRPDALVYIFEIDPTELPEFRDPRIQYFTTGLGGFEGDDEAILLKSSDAAYDSKFKVKTLYQILVDLNHSYIDVLKMDIEGFEFRWLYFEGDIVMKRIGQFLVEVHSNIDGRHGIVRDALAFTSRLEELDMRVFHKENNRLWQYGAELSLIQKKWSQWESNKSKLLRVAHVPEGFIYDSIVKFEHHINGEIQHSDFLLCDGVLYDLPDKATHEFVLKRFEDFGRKVTVVEFEVPQGSSIHTVAREKGFSVGPKFVSVVDLFDQQHGTITIKPEDSLRVYMMTPDGKRANIPSFEVYLKVRKDAAGSTKEFVLPHCQVALIPFCPLTFDTCIHKT